MVSSAAEKVFIKLLLTEENSTKTQIHDVKTEKLKELDKKWFSKKNPKFECVFSPKTNCNKKQVEKDTTVIGKRL